MDIKILETDCKFLIKKDFSITAYIKENDLNINTIIYNDENFNTPFNGDDKDYRFLIGDEVSNKRFKINSLGILSRERICSAPVYYRDIDWNEVYMKDNDEDSLGASIDNGTILYSNKTGTERFKGENQQYRIILPNESVNRKSDDGINLSEYIFVIDNNGVLKDKIKVEDSKRKLNFNTEITVDTDIIIMINPISLGLSMNSRLNKKLISYINSFVENLRNKYKNWRGNYLIRFRPYNPEFPDKWLEDVYKVTEDYDKHYLIKKNILFITFQNFSNSYYPSSLKLKIDKPTKNFTDDYYKFIYTSYYSFNNFIGVNIPIFRNDNELLKNKIFLQHTLAAHYGTSMSENDFENEKIIYDNYNISSNNNLFTTTEFNNLKESLKSNNNYFSNGLKNYNWKGIWTFIENNNDFIFTNDEFVNKLNNLLKL